MQYYEVAPLKLIRANAAVFTYSHDNTLTPGSFVMVPVGKSIVQGVVVARVLKPPFDTKPITEVSAIPPLPPALLQTSLWISEYYACHYATVLQTVLPKGLLKKRRALTGKTTSVTRKRIHFLLNHEQQLAVQKLLSAPAGTALLHGITGSGKTALYIELTKHHLAAGKSAIVLVPEIALTPQVVAEFQQHFTHVIITHSRQTEAERHAAWLAAAHAATPIVVIGPRSALFMPLKAVGLIVIDEAHEPSFKQDQSPRYSALRVASILASHHNALVIQGSATPLVSEYYTAKQAGRPIITLTKKAKQDATDPSVTVVDMTKKHLFTKHRLFSDELIAAITATLETSHQVLLFHNRRGSASTTLCESCSWSAICPRCFVPFTLHADAHTLRCHVCGMIERVPTSCPVCRSADIIFKGIGTKLIETEVKKLFPNKKVARFDGDAKNEQTVEQRYQELYDGDIDIIIGTQVIAKGLDLPHLRLVGVIQADAGLTLPDFIAAERTFQLLAQVVGRVGRSSHASSVIVQSFQPNSLAVQCGITQNYHAFYTHTILERKKALYPPFTYLLKLTCVYKTEAAAIKNARALAAKIRQDYPTIALFGPAPAFYERQHDTFRWQIVVKSPKRSILLELLTIVPPAHWQTDIDAQSLL